MGLWSRYVVPHTGLTWVLPRWCSHSPLGVAVHRVNLSKIVESQKGECHGGENVYPVLGGWVGDEPVKQVFYVGDATHWINVGVATVVCSLPAWCRGSL
jgi:hypothetical protein